MPVKLHEYQRAFIHYVLKEKPEMPISFHFTGTRQNVIRNLVKVWRSAKPWQTFDFTVDSPELSRWGLISLVDRLFNLIIPEGGFTVNPGAPVCAFGPEALTEIEYVLAQDGEACSTYSYVFNVVNKTWVENRYVWSDLMREFASDAGEAVSDFERIGIGKIILH